MITVDVADDRFLIEWLGVKGKEQRQHWAWNKEHEDIMRHAYIYYYTSAFAKPCYREALAKIPHVFQVYFPCDVTDVRLTTMIFSMDMEVILITCNNQMFSKESAKSHSSFISSFNIIPLHNGSFNTQIQMI
jgi:hypothetical protein